jgi:hypothetical protein
VKLLKKNNNGEIEFDAYFEYIRSLRMSMSVSAFAFASNFDHYRMDSRVSLHDAWVQSLHVLEVAVGDRRQTRKLAIELHLLGPYHNSVLRLSYSEVRSYAADVRAEDVGSIAHGDISMHELTVDPETKVLSHEIQFVSGSTLRIECGDLEFEELPLSS